MAAGDFDFMKRRSEWRRRRTEGSAADVFAGPQVFHPGLRIEPDGIPGVPAPISFDGAPVSA